MAIVKTGAPNPVIAGNTLTYTLEVVNHGPSDAQDVTVSDPLPAEVTYISSSTTTGTCTEASEIVTCELGTLAVGGTHTITIVTTAEPGTTSGFVHQHGPRYRPAPPTLISQQHVLLHLERVDVRRRGSYEGGQPQAR